VVKNFDIYSVRTSIMDGHLSTKVPVTIVLILPNFSTNFLL